MGSEKQIIVFNHISKTAGSMMGAMMYRQYKNVYCNNPAHYHERYQRLQFQEDINNCDTVIMGQISYDYKLIKNWNNDPKIFITMLRNPIKRLLSMYHFLAYNNIGMSGYELKLNQVTLREWLTTDIQADNFVIRYLISKYDGEISQQDFDEAKQRLETDYEIVGITEMFDESLYMMFKQLKWDIMPFYPNKINVTDKPNDAENLSTSDIEYLMESNRYDIELYNYFRRKLEDDLSKLPPESKIELELFLKGQKQIKEGKGSFLVYDIISSLGLMRGLEKQEIGLFIFGTGEGARLLSELLPPERYEGKQLIVKGFLDNDPLKHAKEFSNATIFSPSKELIGLKDYVIIASTTYGEEMKKQLLSLGIEEDKIIYPFYSLHYLLQELRGNVAHEKNKLFLTIDDSEKSIVSHYETNLVYHIRRLGIMKDEIRMAIFAFGNEKQFIMKALKNISENNFARRINFTIAEMEDIDIYVIGSAAEAQVKYVDTLLSQGINYSKLVFLPQG